LSQPLWVRRKFFDDYGNRAGERAAGLPPRGVRLTCPCCGYPTLGGRGSFEICELCWWEDDGQDDPDADEVRGGPNHDYSLTEARMNFERHLVMYPPREDRRVGGPDSEAVKEIKRSILAAFDEMTSGPPAERLNELWRTVLAGERALYKEMKRRTRLPLPS
jgi:Cysteine-rich CPCC